MATARRIPQTDLDGSLALRIHRLAATTHELTPVPDAPEDEQSVGRRVRDSGTPGFFHDDLDLCGYDKCDETVTTTSSDHQPKIVYWHRELPPLETELIGAERTIEANSRRVSGTIAHRGELWDQCYRQLMDTVESRLAQEIARLGGHFAHVHDEAIEPKRDDAAGEAWMHGRFSYMVFRRASAPR